MTQGQSYWQKIQLGRETVAGTAVAATAVHRGVAKVTDNLETVFPDENIGLATGSDRSYIPKLGAEISFDDTPATFENLLHVFEAGVKAVGTGVADGAGSGKVYAYPFPTTTPITVADIKTYTLEGGDNAQCEEAEYCVVQEWELKGKADEAWTYTAKWFGRQLTPTTYTGALAVIAVEECLFNKTKIYLDAAAFGSTLVSNQLIEASIKGKTGFKPRSTASGAKYFSHAEWTAEEMEITAELTFMHDASAIAEKALWRAGTARLLQLKCEGTALATAGTYTTKTLKIDLPGKWDKFESLDNDGGASIVKGSFKVRYSTVAASSGVITIVNEIAAVA